MGGVVWLPQKMSTPYEKRDTSKWCEFHYDHGHRTEDYITLRMEVNELDHLRDVLSDRAQNRFNDKSNETTLVKIVPASPPKHNQIINTISRGS